MNRSTSTGEGEKGAPASWRAPLLYSISNTTEHSLLPVQIALMQSHTDSHTFSFAERDESVNLSLRGCAQPMSNVVFFLSLPGGGVFFCLSMAFSLLLYSAVQQFCSHFHLVSYRALVASAEGCFLKPTCANSSFSWKEVCLFSGGVILRPWPTGQHCFTVTII